MLTKTRAYPKRAVGPVASDIRRARENALRREGERLLVKVGVSARLPFLVKVVHECGIEAK
jgi:hypothetical protein